jgi:hypothetical protein
MIPTLVLTVLSLVALGALCAFSERLTTAVLAALTAILFVISIPVSVPIALGALAADRWRRDSISTD